MEVIQDTRPFKCDQCPKAFAEKPTYLEHVRRVHKKLKRFSCDHCDYTSYYNCWMKTHLQNKHSKTKIGCDHCDKFFTSVLLVNQHVKFVHEKPKRFHCKICDYSTYHNFLFKRHLNQKHSTKEIIDEGLTTVTSPVMKPIKTYLGRKKKHFRCDSCDFSTLSHHLLQVHECSVAQFEVKSYKCDHCDKSFHDKFDLEDHLKLIHTNCSEIKCLDYTEFQDLMCDQCEETFPLKNQLEIHIESIHEMKNTEHLKKNEKKLVVHIKANHGKKAKTIKCDHCDKSYNKKSHLIEHMRDKHYEIPKWPCDHCDKSFNRKSHLVSHVKSKHEQQKHHFCIFCDYSTYYKNNLEIHMKGNHTNERDFLCVYCDKSYITFSHLQSHKKTVHKI
jgi:KRAB domain-containing zinc finger protein